MKSIFIILPFFSFNLMFGQTGLTSFPADIPMQDSLNIELIDIQKSDYPFYFRLLLSGQNIEIFSQDKVSFQGKIINFIKEYEQVKIDDDFRTQALQLHSQKMEIDSSLAKTIAHQIIKSEQHSIPTDTLISTWTKWYLHCGSLVFEIKNEDKYIKQSFHCPWSQPDSVEFRDVVLSNYTLVKQELKLDSIYREFMSQLPKGKIYSRSGYGMTYIMTEKQSEAWQKDKPRRDYLKEIKDSIDIYLNTKLDSLQASSDAKKQHCYDSYHLTFGKNGKLKKIWIHPYGKMKIEDGFSWYIEDRLEIWKCYRHIKRIFKKVNLKSFNLEHEVNRTFYFDLGEGWKIIDNTTY